MSIRVGGSSPPITITDTTPVASQAAMLALTAQRGDIAIRTDFTPARAFILTTDDPSVVGNWTQLAVTADAVTSVDGQTGSVSLTGTYVRVIEAPLSPYRYGAKGDGVTDDTAALQAALNDCEPVKGELLLPIGTFLHSGVKLATSVSLRGVSKDGSVLKLKNGANGTSIGLKDATQSRVSVRDLTIDGNASGQSGSTCHGIDLSTTGAGVDGQHHLDNLYVHHCAGSGLYHGGDGNGGETHLSNIFSYFNDVHGFYSNKPDSFWDRCSTGQSGLQGFNVPAPNARFVNCKAWYAGRITAASGDGFTWSTADRVQMLGCEAQDNKRHGYALQFTKGCVMIGCTGDSNGTGVANSASFYLNSVSLSLISGVSYDRAASPTVQYHVQFAGSTAGNIIDLAGGATAGGFINGSIGDNTVRIERTSGQFSRTALGGPVATTAPSAGAAAALPATPAGYLTVTIDGTDRQIPFF